MVQSMKALIGKERHMICNLLSPASTTPASLVKRLRKELALSQKAALSTAALTKAKPRLI